MYRTYLLTVCNNFKPVVTFTLNFDYNPNYESNCYTITRYLTPVDTIKPSFSFNGDIYGKFYLDDSTTNIGRCGYTSNIVVIRAKCANKSITNNFTSECGTEPEPEPETEPEPESESCYKSYNTTCNDQMMMIVLLKL